MRQSRWTCNPQNLPIEQLEPCNPDQMQWHHLWGLQVDIWTTQQNKGSIRQRYLHKKNRNLIASGSGKAHRKISKAFEPSISKNVLPMSLHVLRSHPVLSFFVGKILICINTYNHKLHKICLQNKKNWIKLLGPAEELSLQKCYFNYILVTLLE